MSPVRLGILTALFLTAWIGPAAAAGPPAEAARPAGWKVKRPSIEARRPLPPVPLLVERLASPKFAERVAATRDLARSGLAAVGPLREAAASDKPEVSVRAVAALEELWLRAMSADDEQTAAAALVALDELSLADEPALRARAEGLLDTYAEQIEPFAINEIRRLGGSIRYADGIGIVNDDGTFRPQIQFILIGRKWTGSEEGLRYIRRIRSSMPFAVYFIRGIGLPEGAVERFAARAPRNVTIQERGAFLGIAGSSITIPGERGVPVQQQLAPDAPAAKGGMRPGDYIIEFNNRPIRQFEDLIEELKKLEPDQTVDAAVLRGNERVPLRITVEEWR